jgi:hypothetical protein
METTVTVDATVLANNRSKLGNIGAALGGRFFRIGKYALNDEYGEIIAQVRNSGNKDLCLNRGINRFKIDGFDIHSVNFKNAGDGSPCVFINEGDRNANGEDVSAVCQINNSTSPFLQANEESIGRAINEKNRNLIFADPDNIVDIVNRYNSNEVSRIEGLIQILQTAKNSVLQTIENNNKRAQEYKKQLRDSASTAHVTMVGRVEADI